MFFKEFESITAVPPKITENYIVIKQAMKVVPEKRFIGQIDGRQLQN